MGIVSASFWVAINTLFVKQFMWSAKLTFAGSEGSRGGSVAWAGAFFAPMIVWGIFQKNFKFWRLFSIFLIFPFVFLMLLGGVRTAILGMLIIGSLPLLILKIRPVKLLGLVSLLSILVAINIYALYALVPDKAQYLAERVFSTSVSGRTERWATALDWCLNKAGLLGNGIGSSDATGFSTGLLFHNAYLEIWYNTGFFGLLAVLIFLAIYTMRSYRLAFRPQTKEMTEYSHVAFGYMIGLIAIGMFEGAFSSAGGVATVILVIVATLIDKLKNMTDMQAWNEWDNSCYYEEASCGQEAAV
jgi:O-antigen ligase